MVYSPPEPVTACFLMPVAEDETTTVAPGMAAPLLSVMVPMIAVSTVCAGAGAQVKVTIRGRHNRKTKFSLRMVVS
jgi:hypothetical protein